LLDSLLQEFQIRITWNEKLERIWNIVSEGEKTPQR